MKRATLKLFKALPVKKHVKGESSSLMEKTLPYGFVFSPEVIGEYSEKVLLSMLDQHDLFVNPEQMNASFHKSWKKIKTAPMIQLVLEQMIHYLTTYGFEAVGCYSEESVYIPKEKLDIPDIDIDRFKIVIIRGYTPKQLEEKILNLLKSGIAIHEDTQKDLFTIITGLKMDIDPDVIKNKEMKILLYEMLNIVPRDPVEFLRYAVYKSTDNTLLIKNDATIKQIKESTNQVPTRQMFEKYAKTYGLPKLASIFFRFKPLFLAFRAHDGLAPVINKIRKLADTYHQPMQVENDYLNVVTSIISQGQVLRLPLLRSKLKEANIFRKIRLAYALKYRTLEDMDSIQYKIRNGKSFVTTFEFTGQERAKKALDIVLKSIVTDLKKSVKGKTIYIPEHMVYALPATEKMFTGNFPTGSYVTVPKNLIFGVHWTNVSNEPEKTRHVSQHRIDLDLSIMTQNGKYGWDASYRSSTGDIMFSGDMTDAPLPDGATELFFISNHSKAVAMLFVNYFNYNKDVPVPYSIVVGSKANFQLSKNYMLDPNTVLARATSKMDKKQKLLGLATVDSKECRFYFNEAYLGDKISARTDAYVEKGRTYLVNYLQNMITLNDLLKEAGATIVREKSPELTWDNIPTSPVLSLAPEDLEKDTIINLLIANKSVGK